MCSASSMSGDLYLAEIVIGPQAYKISCMWVTACNEYLHFLVSPLPHGHLISEHYVVRLSPPREIEVLHYAQAWLARPPLWFPRKKRKQRVNENVVVWLT